MNVSSKLPKRRIPTDALPIVVQGKRIGHATKNDGRLVITIYNVLGEIEKLERPLGDRTFVLQEET